jgi:DNA-binding transcriptional LysR family regulator
MRRVEQFFAAARTPSPADYAEAEAHLPPPLLSLFREQHPRDIVHASATARWLVERGHEDLDLISAALLHDIGKGEQRRWDRVAHVVLGRAGRRFAAGQSRFELRTALWRSRYHGELAVPRLRAAGASDRVVELTRLHHAKPGRDGMLALLQEADAAC